MVGMEVQRASVHSGGSEGELTLWALLLPPTGSSEKRQGKSSGRTTLGDEQG